jgi:D-alanyl-D-alanine carboxypeptidase
MYARLSIVAHTFAAALAACIGLAPSHAGAEALLVVEVETGKVLHAENATYPWYPASVTKILTTYITLRAIKEGRITLDTLFTVSANASAQAPTKMGFPVGTQVTVDNAIKMLMVKSANDMAVLLAEGVGGSIEGFADLMNQTSQRLGMTQSHWVNPNGLPADEQITSARDLAILARTALREFPEYDHYWHLPGIRFGKRVVRNYNTLLGRYPGADGMKTGFICASGFNLVATASRNGKRLVAVVLGAPNSGVRAVKAAQLLERGFSNGPLAWLTPSLGTVESLTPVNATPPNLREEMCGGHRKRPASEDDEVAANSPADSPYAVFMSALRAPGSKAAALMQETRMGEPVVVFTGPPKKLGTQLAAVDPKTGKPVKPALRPTQVATAPVRAGAIPWTNMSPGSLTDTSPAELEQPADDAIPLPRARPRTVALHRPPQAPVATAKPAVQLAPQPQRTTQALKPAPKPVAAKPAPKPQ